MGVNGHQCPRLGGWLPALTQPGISRPCCLGFRGAWIPHFLCSAGRSLYWVRPRVVFLPCHLDPRGTSSAHRPLTWVKAAVLCACGRIPGQRTVIRGTQWTQLALDMKALDSNWMRDLGKVLNLHETQLPHLQYGTLNTCPCVL